MPSPGNAKLTADTYAGILSAIQRAGRGVAIIAPNTVASLYAGGDIRVSLHGHNIAVLSPLGAVAIRDCGYLTPTTYGRLRQLVPAGWTVSRRNGGEATHAATGTVIAIPGDNAGWAILDRDAVLTRDPVVTTVTVDQDTESGTLAP